MAFGLGIAAPEQTPPFSEMVEYLSPEVDLSSADLQHSACSVVWVEVVERSVTEPAPWFDCLSSLCRAVVQVLVVVVVEVLALVEKLEASQLEEQ